MIFNATKQVMMGSSCNSSLTSKFEKLKTHLLNSGTFQSEEDHALHILIGMASGSIREVFDINTTEPMDDDDDSLQFRNE